MVCYYLEHNGTLTASAIDKTYNVSRGALDIRIWQKVRKAKVKLRFLIK